MVIIFSTTFVLEVNVQVSLKVATKVSFRSKKDPEKCAFEAIFLKQKRWSTFTTIELYLTNLERSYLVQIPIF